MTDSTLNRFLASGTAAERGAFTPAPPTPASGPDPGYFWYETDTNNVYAWDSVEVDWVLLISASGGLIAANNLSDLTSVSTAQTNLGISAFVATLLDDAAATNFLTTLGVSSFVKTILDDADAAAVQATLGLVPGTNVQAYDADLTALAALSGTNTLYYRSGANTWTAVTIGTGITFSGGTLSADAAAVTPTESFVIAVGDETTAITTGTGKVTWRAPYAFTVTAVRASCNTAPTGSTIIIDINETGTTILSTKLSIDASEKTSTTAASAAVISDASIADDAEISIDFDQVGSTIAGAGVKVTLIGHRT